MSRIGRMPVPVPAGVTIEKQDELFIVEGPKGRLERVLPPDMGVRRDDGELIVERPSDSTRHRALHGLTRTLVANMIQGVSQGFEKVLEIRGVGYRVQSDGSKLVFSLGYSHPIEVPLPVGMDVTIETFTPTSQNEYRSARMTLRSIDKEALGQFAAQIRRFRKAEPYKGKGIRYANEIVRRKAGKAAKSTEKKGF